MSKPKASRQAFGEALAALGDEHPAVVVLEADLGKSTKSDLFGARYPQRYFELGIAEQNMVGVAAGLALSGKTAFCCSFACFVVGRFETIRMSVAYNEANVKIVGTHAGVGIGEDGYSQMGLEDVALMRTLPQVEIFQPADAEETAQVVAYLCNSGRPAYLRLTRQPLRPIHDSSYRFRPGALDMLRDGEEVALFATGGTVMHALDAAETLQRNGRSVAVINVPSIRPLDRDAVQKVARRFRVCISVEDHSVYGGLGGALAEILAETGATRLYRHGIGDIVGESGSPEALYQKFRLDGAGIMQTVEERLR